LFELIAINDIQGQKPNGSGFIGMEAACVLAKTCNVTVVGNSKYPCMKVLGSQVGKVLLDLHLEKGIKMEMEQSVKSYIANGYFN
jgi:NADPH-dependent 2,4-dienoyl-CoA reductase/sulfur reductase-like enzyme